MPGKKSKAKKTSPAKPASPSRPAPSSPAAPERGRPPEDLEALRQAVAQRPQDQGAWRALARLLVQGRDLEGAVAAYRRMAELFPSQAEAHNDLGAALLLAGRAEEAVPPLQRATRMEPGAAPYQANLGKACLLLGRLPQAREALGRALSLAPPSERPELAGLLAQCQAGGQAPPALALPPSLLMACLSGGETFMEDVARRLGRHLPVEKLVSDQPARFLEAMARHQTIWLEWGNDLAIKLTREAAASLAGKRVIVRIHAYEVMEGLADRIDFSLVSDLVFVARSMRDRLLERKPEVRGQVKRIHVIPNGVDLERFPLVERAPGQRMAYVGYLNFKKAPMVLMHAFRDIHRQDGRFSLHLAGTFQDLYHQMACQEFIRANGLAGAVSFDGWIKDLPAWLKDKDFVICTSLSESQGMGLMQAMASGCEALIYRFPGAEAIYPEELLWDNLDQLRQALHRRRDGRAMRRFVEDNYSLDAQTQRLLTMLAGGEEVVFAGPAWSRPALPPLEEACFADDLAQRAAAHKRAGQEFLAQGDLGPARVALERALAQSGLQDRETRDALVNTHQARGDMTAVCQVFRDVGAAAAARGDHQAMLEAFTEFYYYPISTLGSYRWLKFDQGVDAILSLAARDVEPLEAYQEVAQRVDPGKIKLAMLLESLDPKWTVVKRFAGLARDLPKDRFEVIVFSKYAPQEPGLALAAELERAGCRVLWDHSNGHEPLLMVRRLLHLLRAVGCDVLLLNTPFAAPWADLVAKCRPARINVKFPSAGGGRESGYDYIFTTERGCLADEVSPAVATGHAYVSDPPGRPPLRQPPSGPLQAVCVGRLLKFFSLAFWKAMLRVLELVPSLELNVIGVEAERFPAVAALPRVRFWGWQGDVGRLLGRFHVLLDTWPLGGASTLREAHAQGLPVISYRTPWHEHFDTHASFHGGMDELVHPELLLERLDAQELAARLTRLAGDPEHYRRVQAQCAAIKVLSPVEFGQRFAEFLLRVTAGGRD